MAADPAGRRLARPGRRAGHPGRPAGAAAVADRRPTHRPARLAGRPRADPDPPPTRLRWCRCRSAAEPRGAVDRGGRGPVAAGRSAAAGTDPRDAPGRDLSRVRPGGRRPGRQPEQAEAVGLAAAFAADFLSWDESDPARRGRVLAGYLHVPGPDPARLGWDGTGRQRAEFAVPGRVVVDGTGGCWSTSGSGSRPTTGCGRPAGDPDPEPEPAGTPAVAPAPTGRGWRGLASLWVRMTVPVVRDGPRLVDRPLGRTAATAVRRSAGRADDRRRDVRPPPAERRPGRLSAAGRPGRAAARPPRRRPWPGSTCRGAAVEALHVRYVVLRDTRIGALAGRPGPRYRFPTDAPLPPRSDVDEVSLTSPARATRSARRPIRPTLRLCSTPHPCPADSARSAPWSRWEPRCGCSARSGSVLAWLRRRPPAGPVVRHLRGRRAARRGRPRHLQLAAGRGPARLPHRAAGRGLTSG